MSEQGRFMFTELTFVFVDCGRHTVSNQIGLWEEQMRNMSQSILGRICLLVFHQDAKMFEENSFKKKNIYIDG